MDNILAYLHKVIPTIFTNKDEETIDIKIVFNGQNVNIQPILRKILNLDPKFPDNVLYTPAGHKYNELEIFTANMDSSIGGGERATSLFDAFNSTQTKLGNLLLQNILLNPITDITILTQRQNIIKDILGSGSGQQILSTLAELSVIEHDLVALLVEDTEEMKEIYKTVFFELVCLKWLNYNEKFMRVFYFFVILFTPVYGICAPFALLFIPYFFVKYFLKLPITFATFWTIIRGIFFGTSGGGITAIIGKVLQFAMGPQNGGGVGGGIGGIGGIKGILLWIVQKVIALINSQVGAYLYIGFIVVTYLWSIYNSVMMSTTYNKIINVFHGKLNKMRTWVSRAVEFYKIVLESKWTVISESLHNRIQASLKHKTIISLLTHKTFTCEPSLFSNKGIILKVWREFIDCKESGTQLLEPLSELIGIVDVWSSLAKWYGAGAGDASKCDKTFCEYISANEPKVVGVDIWNIVCKIPVCNDVNIGGVQAILSDIANGNITVEGSSIGNVSSIKKISNSSNVSSTTETTTIPIDTMTKDNTVNTVNTNNLLITGPNSSGKSTYIKSIIECILLGQTVGIVPAKQFQLTPFHNITTYLNIPDCQGKESLFQAEMNRCYQQLQLLDSSEQQGHFTFSIMDEIFVSTNYQEGMSGFYAIIKKLCKFTKCLNVITTHFDVLAKMDELNIDKKYFDIEINEKTDKIVKDFKVKSGVSKKHMALKLLKNKGFDPEIIKDAEFLYNKLCSEKTDVIEKDNVKADVKADIKADIDTKPDTKPDTKLDTKPDIEDDIEDNIKDTDLYNPKTT